MGRTLIKFYLWAFRGAERLDVPEMMQVAAVQKRKESGAREKSASAAVSRSNSRYRNGNGTTIRIARKLILEHQ